MASDVIWQTVALGVVVLVVKVLVPRKSRRKRSGWSKGEGRGEPALTGAGWHFEPASVAVEEPWGIVARVWVTDTEVEFFHRLRRALPELEIFCQVAMGALLEASDFKSRNAFSQKFVDYVVCRGPNLAVLAIIELDDWSHDNAEARERDGERDEMLMSAGYRVIRWDARAQPNEAEIVARFDMSDLVGAIRRP